MGSKVTKEGCALKRTEARSVMPELVALLRKAVLKLKSLFFIDLMGSKGIKGGE